MWQSLKWFTSLLPKSFRLLRANNPLILASSTAFFSTFALSPILVLIVNVLGFYFSGDSVRENVFAKVREVFGEESAGVIENIVKNLGSFGGNWLLSILVFLFLLFVATTLLQVIRQAINLLWKIRLKQHRKFRIRLIERTKATVLLIITGVLFVISLFLDAAATFLRDYLSQLFPDIQNELLLVLNLVFSLLVVTTWFTLLFKMLPDGRPEWRVAFAGGLLTALLFSAGKWMMGKLLVYSVAVNVFGASASFALILLFIFYSSLILYFGASFTYVFAEETAQPISPGKHGYRVRISAVGTEDDEAGIPPAG